MPVPDGEDRALVQDVTKIVIEELSVFRNQLSDRVDQVSDRVDQLTDRVFRRLDAMSKEIETNRTLLLKDLVSNGLVSNVTKNANADAVAATAKTKPGRAPLYRTVAPGSDDEDNSDSETKKTVVKKKVDGPRHIDTPVLNAPEPPKKRGRPRKSPLHIDDDDARPKNTGKKGGQGTDDTPKRTGTPEKKRGLPPKSPGRTDDTPNATGTPKKKRGRPRKNPENTDDTPETTGTPKKKRGRPRKNPENTDDTPTKEKIRTDDAYTIKIKGVPATKALLEKRAGVDTDPRAEGEDDDTHDAAAVPEKKKMGLGLTSLFM